MSGGVAAEMEVGIRHRLELDRVRRGRRQEVRPGLAKEEGGRPAGDLLPLLSLWTHRLIVVDGTPVVSTIGLEAAAARALSGAPVVYLDGAHSFDPLVIGRVARTRRHAPRKALALVHVARAFTWHQMERLISNCLADALARYEARSALISGLFETLAEERSSDRDIDRMMDRVLESLRALSMSGCSLVCPCPSRLVGSAHAQRLLVGLRGLADRVVHVQETAGRVHLVEETPMALVGPGTSASSRDPVGGPPLRS